MPITSDLGGRNYTLGRGRLFFDRYSAAQIAAGITSATVGEGERFFGNVPEFSITSSEDALDHYSSTGGIKVKDASVTLQLDRTGSFTTDHISTDNLALLFLSDGASTVTQAALVDVTFDITVKPGFFYQLGATVALPTGNRVVSAVTVGTGVGFATAVAQAANYEIDEATGRIYILPTAPAILAAGTLIRVTYSAAAGTRQQVVSKTQVIQGSLRWFADNPQGANQDMLMPNVKLSPDGDYSLVSDDWRTMGFTFEALIKGSLASVYVDGRQV